MIFQPTVNPRASYNESKRVKTILAGKKMQLREVVTYIWVFVKGFRRWRGFILALEWKPDL